MTMRVWIWATILDGAVCLAGWGWIGWQAVGVGLVCFAAVGAIQALVKDAK